MIEDRDDLKDNPINSRDDLMKKSAIKDKFKVHHKKDKEEEDEEDEKSSGTPIFGVFIWVIAAIVAGFFLLGGHIPGLSINSNDVPTTQMVEPTTVEFCNNTHILFEDSNGEEIKGQVWYIQEIQGNQIWEKGLPDKYQKGITYGLWINSSTHFVNPVMFTPDCINENDTTIQYIKFEAFKRDSLSVKMYNPTDVIENELKFYDGAADIELKVTSSFYGKFMPFGGIMIVEYPNRITYVSCNDWEGNSVIEGYHLAPFMYVYQNDNDTSKVFDITKDFEVNGGVRTINCKFSFYNPDNTLNIIGKDLIITMIPADYYLTKTNELKLDTTKERDEVFEYVTNQSIILKEKFE